MLTLTPVVLAYTVDIKLHHSACTEQMMLTCWAEAPVTAKAKTKIEKTRFMKTPLKKMRLIYQLAGPPAIGETRL